MTTVILNAAWVGKIAEEAVGIQKLTRDFNRFRRERMAQYSPTKPATVKRYNNGYDRTPRLYREFLVSYVGLI